MQSIGQVLLETKNTWMVKYAVINVMSAVVIVTTRFHYLPEFVIGRHGQANFMANISKKLGIHLSPVFDLETGHSYKIGISIIWALSE